jgi:Amt family ammonium transporter
LGANGLAVIAFLNTQAASAAAMLAWIFFDGFMGKKPSATGACIGAVVGLVAITPAAGFVTVGNSVFIGVVSSLISNLATRYMSSRGNIDDTLDVFPCHGLGGITGMIFTGIFASKAVNEFGADGLINGGSELFYKHLAALLAISVFTFGGSWLIYHAVNLIKPIRVEPELEPIGLDLSQHDEIANTQ